MILGNKGLGKQGGVTYNAESVLQIPSLDTALHHPAVPLAWYRHTASSFQDDQKLGDEASTILY